MLLKFSFLASAAGLVALTHAAPLPQTQVQAQTTDWPAVWSSQQASMKSQLASMASVESSINHAAPTSNPPAASSAVAAVSSAGAQAAASATATATAVTPQQTMQITPTATAASSTAGGNYAASSYAVTSAGTPPKSGSNGPAVTNSAAWNRQDSSGPAPTDAYKCYGSGSSAPASAFPPTSSWSPFEALFQQNYKLLQTGCANLGYSPENNNQQIQWIHDALVQVGGNAAVDPRFILAIMMQESHGCLSVGTTSNGVTNPGLMQSHNGSEWVGNGASASAQQASIVQMIRDGAQGTPYGNGLVQEINQWGSVWAGARAYNSGDRGVTTGNLNAGNGATGAYVVDIANKLTGWVYKPGVPPKCPGES